MNELEKLKPRIVRVLKAHGIKKAGVWMHPLIKEEVLQQEVRIL